VAAKKSFQMSFQGAGWRVLLVSGCPVNEESGWIDRYLVNYEGIRVDRR